MRIGILSDTHNHRANLKRALEYFRNEQVELLVHCGDVTTLETALLLVEFRLIYVYGNGDLASGEMRQALLSYDGNNFAGTIFQGEIGGIMVSAVHGDQPGQVDKLAQSQQYRYLLHGHTHHRRRERIGQTWVINPGALGGIGRESRSVCLLDLESGAVNFHEIN